DRLVRSRELALRINRASVEEVPTPRFLLGQVSSFALRTLHADEVLLHVLAFRISAARHELAEAAVAQQQVASALWALLFQRNVRHFLRLIESARCLAVGISR